MKNPLFDRFAAGTRDLLEGQARPKGYDKGLSDFVSHLLGDDHALGEIIYKAVRYKHKRDKRDLLKIAAWAFLLWRRE